MTLFECSAHILPVLLGLILVRILLSGIAQAIGYWIVGYLREAGGVKRLVGELQGKTHG